MFQLTPNPTFEKKIEIPVPGGSVQILELEFKYLPKKEFAAFSEKIMDCHKNADDVKAVGLLFDIVKGWNVDAELNKKNFNQLTENYPLAAIQIYKAYAEEIFRAKAGN